MTPAPQWVAALACTCGVLFFRWYLDETGVTR